MTEAVSKDMQKISVTLPDGSVRELPHGATVLDLAASIGAGLAKATLGGRVSGHEGIVDLRTPLVEDCAVSIITNRDDDGLEVIRHSASHIMAEAICRIWPDCKLAIGPSIADGFYYDLDLSHKLTDGDFEKIEKEMKKIISEKLPFERCSVERAETLARFQAADDIYKAELVEGLDVDAEVTLFRHGAFEDLCRGPHVQHTGGVEAFKVMKLAGAYWRGDENRAMLQRVYGTAFANKKALKAYLHRLEEAKKRDHRKLGKELDLFSFNAAAPASPFFHAKGTRLYNSLQNYMRELYLRFGYDEVITPQVFDVEMWHRSGHYEKYKDNMFFTQLDDREFGVKPMNCPGHTLMFGQTLRSYRDLPIRMADFGRLHRYERSGVTAGLTRVRTFCQDDAHIFCREDQVAEEISSVIAMVREVYGAFGFNELLVYLSTRPDKSVGGDDVWEKAEQGLAAALAENEIDYTVNEGDGAFYGPKIDFIVLDALEREWQLGTVQLDFNMPARFGLEYVNAEGGKSQPVMVHRAVMGSIERFMGIILEHFGGKLPVWLSPTQIHLATINDSHVEFAEEAAKYFESQGFSVERDLENAKIGAKIRAAALQKVPYTLVIGDREVKDRTVAVRARGGEDLGAMDLEAFSDMMRLQIANKE